MTKNYLFFTLAMSAMLSVVGGVTCFFLKWLYWDLLKVPIGLGGGLFFFLATPATFILGIPYAVAARWILGLKNTSVGFRQFSIAFSLGSLITVFVLAIIFPCDVQPYFVGGYLMKDRFGGR